MIRRLLIMLSNNNTKFVFPDMNIRKNALEKLSKKTNVSMDNLIRLDTDMRDTETKIRLSRYRIDDLTDAYEMIDSHPELGNLVMDKEVTIKDLIDEYEFYLDTFSITSIRECFNRGQKSILDDVTQERVHLIGLRRDLSALENRYLLTNNDLRILRTAGRMVHTEHTNFAIDKIDT